MTINTTKFFISLLVNKIIVKLTQIKKISLYLYCDYRKTFKHTTI